jgi:hypothetical protein
MNTSPPARRRGRQVLSPEEYKRQRRERRMERTSGLESVVRAWAERKGCAVRVLNDGHHWLFQKPGFMAEWWPNPAFAEASVAGRLFLHAIRIPGGETHRRAQALRTGARNAKNARNSATPGGSPDGLTPICGVLWLARFPVLHSITQAHPSGRLGEASLPALPCIETPEYAASTL